MMAPTMRSAPGDPIATANPSERDAIVGAIALGLLVAGRAGDAILLVVLMVTATYLASRSIPVDLPSGKTGEATTAHSRTAACSSSTVFQPV